MLHVPQHVPRGVDGGGGAGLFDLRRAAQPAQQLAHRHENVILAPAFAGVTFLRKESCPAMRGMTGVRLRG